MSSLLAKKCQKGRIFAVEPIPENIQALNRMLHFRRAENVVVLPVALGESSGNLEMRMPIIEGVKMQALVMFIILILRGMNLLTEVIRCL